MCASSSLGGTARPSSGTSVAIVGSRSFPVGMFPADCIEYLENALRHAGFEIGEVVSGGADGVDTAAAIWAQKAGVPLVELEPDWEAFGKAAGPRRNTRIVERADAMVALWDGQSSGTRDSLVKGVDQLGSERVAVYGIGEERGRDDLLQRVRL